MISQIEPISTVDFDRLVEEARYGILSIPLAQLPPSLRALLTPALEEGQRLVAVEQQETLLHRRGVRQSQHVPDWLESKSLAYRKAYEEFFDTVSNSERRLDGALSELNDSERQLSTRLADVERLAVHLPDGRLAFYENGRFVYADGSAVGHDDLAACMTAKKEADQKSEPLASRREYSAVKNALADTVDVEQKVAKVIADVNRTGDEVRSAPPAGEADLRSDTAGIKGKTDDTIGQSLARYRENKAVLATHFDLVADSEQLQSDRSNLNTATASASFNTSSIGNAEPRRPPPKPVALNLDEVTSAATSHAGVFQAARP